MRIQGLLRPPAIAALTLALASCGGSTPGPSPSGGTRTDTFSGTSSVSAGGGCSGATGHAINTSGAGEIVIALTQASLGQAGIQVCHPGAVNHALECTVPPFATVALNGSLTATIRGGSAQTIVINPVGCDSTAAVAATLSYAVNVTYPF